MRINLVFYDWNTKRVPILKQENRYVCAHKTEKFSDVRNPGMLNNYLLEHRATQNR